MDDRFLFAFFDRPAQEQEDDYEIKETDRCPADGGRDGMLHFAGKCTGGGKFKSKCRRFMRTPRRTYGGLRLHRGQRGDALQSRTHRGLLYPCDRVRHKHTEDCYPAESVSDNTPPRPMRKIGGR